MFKSLASTTPVQNPKGIVCGGIDSPDPSGQQRRAAGGLDMTGIRNLRPGVRPRVGILGAILAISFSMGVTLA